jgi:hypothetical protein
MGNFPSFKSYDLSTDPGTATLPVVCLRPDLQVFGFFSPENIHPRQWILRV